MTYRTRFLVTSAKMGAAVLVAITLFGIVINGIENPVRGADQQFTADFSDVSGLHVNGDVRTKGVLIGKVISIDLVPADGRTLAKVGFTLKEPYDLTENTVMSVKYQNLTGVRYVDFDVPQQDPGISTDHLPLGGTRPSYDITELFNGLEPVLTAMTTDEINEFMGNAIMVLQGDGTGLPPLLESVRKLADYAHDREQVISTLTANLNRVADTMGGKSEQLMDFIRSMSIPVGGAMTVLDEFRKTSGFGPAFMEPLQRILAQLGITADMDVEKLFTQTFSSVSAAVESLRLMPGAFAGLQIPAVTPGPSGGPCSNGVLRLPSDIRVLLNGSEVILCNAK